LKALLADGAHATSTQVLREWNSITLGACSKLLNVLQDATSRKDVQAKMATGYGGDVRRNWMITEWLMGEDTDLRAVEMRARRFLRVDADVAFHEGIDTVRDGTRCQVAQRGPTHDVVSGQWDHDKRCLKTENICSQHAFFDEHIERAKAAAHALEMSSRTPDKAMGKRVADILERMPTNDSKGKACWGAGGLGGDISIALECAVDETLVTTDASFDLICPAIGVEHRRPG
jgi:hypothetical protein